VQRTQPHLFKSHIPFILLNFLTAKKYKGENEYYKEKKEKEINYEKAVQTRIRI
jgi:hypothetical protein